MSSLTMTHDLFHNEFLLKHSPEDFLVREVLSVNVSQQRLKFSIFKLRKREYSLSKALKKIADFFNIPVKVIGFAGIKDKYAITEQYISIPTSRIDRFFGLFNNRVLNINEDLSIEFLGYSKNKIFLGQLTGNEFVVTLRNISKINIDKASNFLRNLDLNYESMFIFPNYFGQQRFGKNNLLAGWLLLKRKYKDLYNIIVNYGVKEDKTIVETWLKKYRNDYVNAFRQLPREFFRLYINSIQSLVFNLLLSDDVSQLNNQEFDLNQIKEFFSQIEQLGYNNFLKFESNLEHFRFKYYLSRSTLFAILQNKDLALELLERKLPLPGYDVDEARLIKYLSLLRLAPEDFINPQIPYLSVEHIYRNAYVLTKIDSTIDIDERFTTQNEKKYKLVLKFFLPKSSYATELVEQFKYLVLDNYDQN